MADHMVGPSQGPRASPSLSSPTKPIELSNGLTRSQDLAGLEHVSQELMSPFPTGQSEYPRDISFIQWVQRGEDPWTPIQGDGGLAIMGAPRPHPQLLQYRENIVPSECSTAHLPSDSGYVSYGARHSVTNISVYDESFDRNTETQSVVGPLNDLQFAPTDSDILSRSSIDHGHPAWQISLGAHLAVDTQSQLNGGIMCKDCRKPLKTKSELK